MQKPEFVQEINQGLWSKLNSPVTTGRPDLVVIIKKKQIYLQVDFDFSADHWVKNKEKRISKNILADIWKSCEIWMYQ